MTTKSPTYLTGEKPVTPPFVNQNPAIQTESEELKTLLEKDPKPWAPTVADKAILYLKPFFKYVFNLRPAIPNIIYVLVSIGVMQLVKAKDFFPKIDWLEPVLFYGLLAGIAVQILFASAKTISIPLLTLGACAWAIWAQTTQGVQLPIQKEIFQYMMALGAVGVIISSVFNP